MKNNTARATFMSVADTPATLRYLQESILNAGHRLVPIPNGPVALAAAERNPANTM